MPSILEWDVIEKKAKRIDCYTYVCTRPIHKQEIKKEQLPEYFSKSQKIKLQSKHDY